MTEQDLFAHYAQQDEADFPLARTALLFARSEYQDLSVEDYLARLDTIAADIHSRLPPQADNLDKLRALNYCLFRQRGFRGNESDYYDPRNSYLNIVLDRKLGLPITLSIIYLEIAWRLQLPLQGIGFPGHFLVKLPVEDGIIVIDPFFEGITLDEDDLCKRIKSLANQVSKGIDIIRLLSTADKRSILSRMLRNLKSIYQQREDFPRALNVCNHILLLEPDSAQDRRDRGLILEQLDCPQAALQDYRQYLALAGNEADTQSIQGRLQALQTKSLPRFN